MYLFRLCVLTTALITISTSAADDFTLEPGFSALFVKGDLTGWKTKKEKESLDGKSEAYKGRFKLAGGVLTIDPKVKGDVIIETAKEFAGDATIRFDFRPATGCNNDLFFRGTKFDINPKMLTKVKLDEWNELEIAVKADKAEFRINGELTKTLPAKVAKSPLGIRAEFGAIEIRKLRVKAGE